MRACRYHTEYTWRGQGKGKKRTADDVENRGANTQVGNIFAEVGGKYFC